MCKGATIWSKLLPRWIKADKADRHNFFNIINHLGKRLHPIRKDQIWQRALKKGASLRYRRHFCENWIELSLNFLSRHIASLPCRTQKKPSPPLVTFSTSSHRSQNTKYLLPNFWQLSNTSWILNMKYQILNTLILQ